MADIKAKDVATFGRILQQLGRVLEEHPLKLIELFSESNSNKGDESINSVEERSQFPELDGVDIFELGRTLSREELIETLTKYDVEKLRYLIRRNRLGALKSKSKQTLVEYMADQSLRRAVDVFRSHG